MAPRWTRRLLDMTYRRRAPHHHTRISRELFDLRFSALNRCCRWTPAEAPPEYSYPSETVAFGQHLTEEDALAVLRDHVEQSQNCGVCCDVFCCNRNLCCWSSSPLDSLKLNPMVPSFAFTVKLFNYCEQRHRERREKPFCHGQVDDCGYVPGDWEMDAGTTSRPWFTEGHKEIKLPHSEQVHDCPTCYGHGHTRCCRCNGRGCHSCCSDKSCSSCSGNDSVQCRECHGRGHKECNRCCGEGRLRFWQVVIVEWVIAEHLEAVQQCDGDR